MRWSWHGTVSSLPSGRSISKGKTRVTRFRSRGEKIKEEAGREWEGREALFCLGEKTRPERRARKLSVCLLTPHVLRPATLSYIFVVRAPFLFAPAPTKYEGRFAGVLRVKTRYRIGGASATLLLRRFCTDSVRSPPPPPLPSTRCRRAVAEKGCIWHVSKVSLHTCICSRCEILLTRRSSRKAYVWVIISEKRKLKVLKLNY